MPLCEFEPGDPPRARRALRADGYLLLRGLIPAEAVHQAAEQLLDVLRARGWLRRGDPDARLSRLYRLTGPDPREFAAVYRELQAVEALHEMIRRPEIEQAVTALLGPSLLHPRCIIRTTVPVRRGGPADPAAHRDYPGWRIRDMLTVWAPLLACPPQRAGLCVLPGSQHGPLEHPTDLRHPGWATTTFAPGDALILHCYTVHAALPNHTDTLRLSVDSRWQALAEPLPAWTCAPDSGGEWPEYTERWSDPHRVLPPPGARLADSAPGAPLTALPASPLLREEP